MQLWTAWLELIEYLLTLLSTDLALGTGLAIIGLTLIVRTALLPLSWHTACQAAIRQKKVAQLAPDLKRLRERFPNQPERLMQATIELYRARGIRFVELRPLLSTLAQLPVLLGMFSVLRRGYEASRFMWIENLTRPDFWIALVAGVTTAMIMLANPELPEQTRLLLIAVPAILAFVFALKFSSALALYWVTSNVFTTVQTLFVHRVVRGRFASGAITP